jgi:hypothetical protein
MIRNVNRKTRMSPFRYIAVTPPEWVRLFREYRRLYPDGRLHVYAAVAFALAAVSMLVLAVSFRAVA